ncbi:LuxR C-terminal-related transcriptional regulator [Nonomuraea soli]|uniref:DNA-binding NarL/FixJ family response regulator n=1 Tax=Nonomuraea soli TaxID=1032476 RepID=A0A7W0CPI5_9ACTN|nr:response regulator transcription factor [Nonomuraea soli]MBA2894842.1 DNA-binding NarL/FixJ family response regulator [Nonomuraea soli]
MIKIAVVDDHDLIRHGLEHILRGTGEFEVVASGRDVSVLDGRAEPDVLILDLYLGVDEPCLTAIAELAPLYNVLVISASAKPGDLVRAIRAGARGYVTKSDPAELMATALRTVAARGFYLSAGLADILHAQLAAPAPDPAPAVRLAPREEETLAYIAQGFTYDQIARRMGIKKSTVDTHIERIRRKLQVDNKAQLIAAALRRIERGG